MSSLHVDLPSVMDVCRQNAARSPDAPAFDDGTEALTWGEFDRESERAANAFAEYTAKGDRVVFLCESSITQTTLLMGAMKAGCVVTNAHLKAPTEVLQYCVSATSPKLLVVDESYTDRVADDLWGEVTQSVATVVTIGEATRDYEQSAVDFLADRAATPPDVLVDEDDILVIWWTSGSTGRPKGWCHTNRSLYIKAMKGAARYGVDRFGTTLLVLSPSFGAWYNPVLKALFGCERIRFLTEWDPETWLDVVESEGVTHTGRVATLWRELVAHDVADRDLSSLDVVYTTGEKIAEETLAQLREHVCDDVVQSYGSTEMYGTVLYNEEMQGDRIHSVGKAQTGTEVRIVDPDGTPDDVLDAGERGEIVIRGPDVPAWAWGNTGKTRESFEDGWWRSGDLGYRDEAGYLFLEGRVDFQIKSRGVKIVPERIEGALNDHPDVKQAVVVGVSDPDYGQKVTAIVVPATPDLTEDDLDQWCLDSDAIAPHQRPRAYHFVDAIDTTSSGKVDRYAVMDRLGLD